MGLLSSDEQQQVAAAIARVERECDAELVTVLAAKADDYRDFALLWASLLALLLPGAINFYPAWLDSSQLLLVQWASFIGLALLLSRPRISVRLVPQRVRHWRASNLARRQFLERNLHHTTGEIGMLIFVAEAERYVEILVDRGISRHLPDATWQSQIDTFTRQVQQGQTLRGFLDCIQGCGEQLKQHLPASHHRNELTNRLVLLP